VAGIEDIQYRLEEMNLELEDNLPRGAAGSAPSKDRYEPKMGLSIDKTSDSIKVKNGVVLGLEDQFTFGVWIKPTNNVQPQDFFLVVHIANNYALSCGNGCVQVAFRNEKPGWMWKKTSIQLTMDCWTHIAVSYDSVHRQALVFKDGVQTDIIQVKGRLLPNVNHLIVKLLRLSAAKEDEPNAQQQGGTAHPPPPRSGAEDSFTGMVAHLKIWKSVLTEQQLKLQLNRPLDQIAPEEQQHLLCWWKFDEGHGTKVSDFMEQAPDGIIVGCRWWVGGCAIGKVEIPKSTLQSDLSVMFNNPLSSDVQLTVDDHPGPPINAHRALLAARSENFRAMLVNEMTEANSKIIILKEIKYDILLLLVQYLYTDAVAINEANVVDLLIASDRFQIKRLQAMCEDFVMKSIELDNVCNLFELADKVHASQLKVFCKNWIVSNWSEVLRKGDDMHLSIELQREIRNEVLQVYFHSNNSKRRKTSS